MYLLFALGTAVFDWGTYIIYSFVVGSVNMQNAWYAIGGNAIAWFLAVTFAFVTNKLIVFRSKHKGIKNLLLKEIPLFYGSRLVTLGVTEGGVAIIMATVTNPVLTVGGIIVNWHWIAKLIMSLVGIAINYAFGKFLVFRKKKNGERTDRRDGENISENTKDADIEKYHEEE